MSVEKYQMRFENIAPNDNEFLFLLGMPTPNGRIHLGHIAGPFLKVDVISRALQRKGAKSTIVSGSDVYESYVDLKSEQTGWSREEVCNHFHPLMKKDIEALDINLDDYFNPIEAHVRSDFDKFTYNIVQELVDLGLTEVRDETILYSPTTKRYMAGCWILGDCPICKSASGGYLCENCGGHYRPMDLINAYPRMGETDCEEIKSKSLYLKNTKKQELYDYLEKSGLSDFFMNALKTYFQHQGDRVRLTSPGTWGVPYKTEGAKHEAVIFSYPAMYSLSLYCGKIYAEKYNKELSPFHPDSDVITITTIGIDNSLPYFAGIIGSAIESGSYKPFDYCLTNLFFKLENSKFSTSRLHVIWGADIIEKTPLTSNMVRYYMIKVNPQEEETNFDINEFISIVNTDLVNGLQTELNQLWEQLDFNKVSAPNEAYISKLEELIRQQDDALSLNNLKLAACLDPLRAAMIMDVENDSSSIYWWIKGIALLSWPIMPSFSLSIWEALGAEGDPSLEYFFQVERSYMKIELPTYFTTMTYEDIKPCLPETLLKNK